MRLTDLNARWIGNDGEGVSDKDGNPVAWREAIGDLRLPV
jgi:hypothetical protein